MGLPTHSGRAWALVSALFLFAAACGSETKPSAAAEGSVDAAHCRDGLDNDFDQLIDCADPDCNGVVCREAVAGCDLAETCSGGACPADQLQPDGAVCRPAAGACDEAEFCDGVNAGCPQDAVKPATVVCRPASDVCDREELCDGSAALCPDDEVEPAGTACRPAADLCDAPESCDGLAKACPADDVLPATAECRPAAGDCDVAESCTGASAACPADLLRPSTFECRAAAGGCDAFAELCTGSSPACPPDVSGCGAGDYCDGTSCVPKKANGVACGGSVQCLSGFCADGVCCDNACGGPCVACNVPGSVGACVQHAAFTDPENGCGGYTCNGSGSCFTSCSGACSQACKASHYCTSLDPPLPGTCVADKAAGGTCANACQCTSGFCADGVCCNNACTGPCVSCRIAGHAGSCWPHPRYSDPDLDCGLLTCNGAGACYTSCSPPDTLTCNPTCKRSAFCNVVNQCQADLRAGSACYSGCMCTSDQCFILCL